MNKFKNIDSMTNHEPSRFYFILETTLMIICSLLISYVTDSVMVVWTLLGSTVSFMIAFTLPNLFFVKIRKHKGYTWRNVLAIIISIFSIFAIILCTWQAIINLKADPCPTKPY